MTKSQMLVRGSLAVKNGAIQQGVQIDWPVVGQKRSMPEINMLLVQLQLHSTSTNTYFMLFYWSVPVKYCC